MGLKRFDMLKWCQNELKYQSHLHCGARGGQKRVNPVSVTPTSPATSALFLRARLACSVPDDLPLDHVDDHFRNIGGMVRDALQVLRNIGQAHGA